MPRQPRCPQSLVLILSGLILLVLLLGCAPCCVCPFLGGTGGDGNNTTTGSVTGTCYIMNNSGKTAVPGLAVTVGNNRTETDNNGNFRVSGLAPGTYDIGAAGGDLGYSGRVTVVAGQTTNLGDLQLHGTLPPPPKTGGTTGTTAYPTTAEGVITAYYAAINAKDYAAALSFLAEQMGGQNMNSIKASYEPYVKNIQIAKIQRTPSMDFNSRSIYVVTFTVDYIQHYPAGNGNLPTVHSMKFINGQWKIVEIGTG
jgi:hypothetical protein